MEEVLSRTQLKSLLDKRIKEAQEEYRRLINKVKVLEAKIQALLFKRFKYH